MNRQIASVIIPLALILTASCNQTAKDTAKTYDYKVLLGATGNDKQINDNGKLIDITFADNSNQLALKALLSLKWEILQYNSTNKIKVVGVLTNATDNKGARKFVLDHWTISVPFKYAVQPKDWLPGDEYLIGTKNSLDKSCFTTDININFKNFQRVD